ncbi:MAG TPA: hypothetical protein DCE44_19240 [Verrucomicrobiales bacterium]|nr:hypothetical protein [Verrucomicrobiales bacterium]
MPIDYFRNFTFITSCDFCQGPGKRADKDAQAIFQAAIDYLSASAKFMGILNILQKSGTAIKIHISSKADSNAYHSTEGPMHDQVCWNPLFQLTGFPARKVQTPAIGLAHELGHILQMRGLGINGGKFANTKIGSTHWYEDHTIPPWAARPAEPQGDWIPGDWRSDFDRDPPVKLENPFLWGRVARPTLAQRHHVESHNIANFESVVAEEMQEATRVATKCKEKGGPDKCFYCNYQSRSLGKNGQKLAWPEKVKYGGAD